MTSSSSACGGQPGLGEDAPDVVDQSPVQLPGGDVDADVEHRGRVGPCRPAVRRLPASIASCQRRPARQASVSTQVPSWPISPICSAMRMKRSGRDEAAHRVAPAQQGLGADQPTRRDVAQRLVDDGELAVRRREPQVVLDLGALGQLGEHARLEAHPVAGGAALRLVHGEVGLAQQGVGVGDPRGADRQADAGADVRGAVRQRDGLGDEGGDPLGDLDRDLLDVRAGEQDGELVAAEPGDGVELAARTGSAGRPPP